MKLDLRPLLAGDKLLTFDYELPFDSETTDPTSFLYGVSFPSPMKVVGDITNTAGYMRLTVKLSVEYSAVCARCLTPVNGEFTLSLEKTVAPRDVLDGVAEDKLDDYAIIEDGFLDIDGELITELEMAFPSRFLCKEDCRGLHRDIKRSICKRLGRRRVRRNGRGFMCNMEKLESKK